MDTATDTMQAQVTIQNQLGLHARPAMSFVDTAQKFASQITVKNSKLTVDGKSIMQMMLLAAERGTELLIQATGPDAAAAINALRELVDRKFDEE